MDGFLVILVLCLSKCTKFFAMLVFRKVAVTVFGFCRDFTIIKIECSMQFPKFSFYNIAPSNGNFLPFKEKYI